MDDRATRDTLFEQPGRIPFFQAVRLLRLIHADRAMIGEDADPAEEFIRFSSDRSYAFPVGDVANLEAGEDGSPDAMLVSFMGVASPHSFGSLPIPYIEEIRGQDSAHEPALGDFIDLFNHRIISLFFRAWTRSRPEVLHSFGGANPFEKALRALIGIDGDALQDQLPGGGLSLLARAGLLSRRPASASAIEGLVESLFGVPAKIQQYVPTWYEIDDSDRTRLGSRNTRLGDDVNLGSEVSLCQSHFRVTIGPMDFETYRRLLPDGESHAVLTSSVRLATGAEFEFDFSLSLCAAEVPALRLGDAPAGEAPNPCRLGWSTWINNEGLGRDADDSIFVPHHAVPIEHAQETIR